MKKYTCDEKLSEKKSGKMNKKLIAMILAGTVIISGVVANSYDKVKGALEYKNLVNEKIEERENNDYLNNQPEYGKFLQQNLEKLNELKKVLSRYQELYNMEERSAKDSKEMAYLVEMINNDYSKDIQNVALNVVKAKIADVNKEPMSSLKIDGKQGEESSFVVYKGDIFTKNINDDINGYKELYKAIDKGSEENLELENTVFNLMEIQNGELNSELSKTRNANLLYNLYKTSVKTMNKTYLKGKDNKLVEIGVSEKGRDLDEGEER